MRLLFVLFCFSLLSSCRHSSSKNNSNLSFKNNETHIITLKYARNIEIQKQDSEWIFKFKNIEKELIISEKKLPIKSCLVMNSSSVAFINAMEQITAIQGVASPEYIYNSSIHQLLNENKIQKVGSDTGWDFEKILNTEAQFIFCNYNPSLENTYYQLKQQGFYIFFVDEYIESNPLARSEYLKFFGILFDKSKLVNSIFEKIEKNYKGIQKKTSEAVSKPKILSKIMYGDIWYMPAGQSYTAQLYKDANSNYPWQTTKGNHSLELSFEEVFEKDGDADLWIDVSDLQHSSELLAQNNAYSSFSAFQNKYLFSLAGRKRGLANDFYEQGVVYADSVLQEVNYIFRNYGNIDPDSLVFYKKLN